MAVIELDRDGQKWKTCTESSAENAKQLLTAYEDLHAQNSYIILLQLLEPYGGSLAENALVQL